MPFPPIRLPWIGFRGTALLLFGLVYVLMGLAVLFNPDPNPALIHTHLPTWFRVTLWCGTGSVAVVACVVHRKRDGIGDLSFGLLFLAPSERALSFGYAMLRETSFQWLAGTAVYLLFTGIVVLCAGWPEPSDLDRQL